MSTDFGEVIHGIRERIDREVPFLAGLPETVISCRRNEQNRTIKQLLGHLVDSASNNHQRMVRLQYNRDLVFPDYTQDNDRWIAIQDYQHADWPDLIQLWKYYNIHMIQVIRSADPGAMENSWTDFEGNRVTLRRMIEGYLWHLDLHIGHIHELADQTK